MNQHINRYIECIKYHTINKEALLTVLYMSYWAGCAGMKTHTAL